jgi:hypothetical protein
MKWFKTCLIWIWLSKKYCAFIRPLSGNSLTSIYTVAENINLTLLWCRVERQCTKDYSYDNGRIKIKKGQLVTVPAFALHHMEEYCHVPSVSQMLLFIGRALDGLASTWLPLFNPFSLADLGYWLRRTVATILLSEFVSFPVCLLVCKLCWCACVCA